MHIEVNERVLAQRDIKLPNGVTAMVTPALDEDYWLLRVPLTPRQAVVLFPKFSTYGIGFQHEEDWNTNLPSACPREEIYEHIEHNCGEAIEKAQVLEAIGLLQAEIVRLTGEPRFAPALVDGKEVAYFKAHPPK